jgi:hypothetical protein
MKTVISGQLRIRLRRAALGEVEIILNPRLSPCQKFVLVWRWKGESYECDT